METQDVNLNPMNEKEILEYEMKYYYYNYEDSTINNKGSDLLWDWGWCRVIGPIY